MPTVYIPSLLQTLTSGKGQVEAGGSTVREVIRNLEKAHPGLEDRLIEGGRLRANISVAVDGEVTPLGLLEPVGEDSEIHFVAAIKGGRESVQTKRKTPRVGTTSRAAPEEQSELRP